MIDLSFLRGTPVAVLGLGKTGLTSARALAESGVPVTVWDDTPAQIAAARGAGLNVVDLNTADLAGVKYLLLSPGIPHDHPAPHPVVTRARAAGVEIVSDIELLVRANPKARIAGITGTNGKSTTTALIGHILQTTGMPCAVGGNLGPAVLGFETLDDTGTYVIELSSYQLELTPSLAPLVGVLLNITPDHLDRHGGMEGYVAAKASLFRNGGDGHTAVIGIEDEHCRAIAAAMAGFDLVTIGAQNATIAYAHGSLHDSRDDTHIDLTGMAALPGRHNWQDAAAAYAACRALGLTAQQIEAGIGSFPGLVHRQQLVATIDGIRFVNDSKATNADAAEKALSCYDAIYWIAGGQPKEGGLNGLEHLMPRVRHAFLIGEAAPQFGKWLQGRAAFTQCGTLDHAVKAAFDMARDEQVAGAVVLLSPACASWDQFRNFEHRGESFSASAQHLAQEAAA